MSRHSRFRWACSNAAAVPASGFILGSVINLDCVLHADGVPDERYVAAIQGLGIDIGSTEVAVAWKVFAPVPWRRGGDLAGTYAGGESVAGGRGNVLTGGSTGSFALQPVSSQDEAGLTIAAGLGGLELRAAP
ncbi:DUF992 domain-containing protein [Bradyrhizobium erythrophlei]|uniref:DUF992 domain-containing protein n=1 Tax=Bradyrhizobium erythrophlei TaxID=1437360 RepID=UPI0035E9EBFE